MSESAIKIYAIKIYAIKIHEISIRDIFRAVDPIFLRTVSHNAQSFDLSLNNKLS